MSKITRVLRCNSCGVVLQSDNANLPGFIPSDLLKENSDRVIYCNDCYRDLQINIGKSSHQIDDDTLKVLEDAVASDALVCYVIDLFSFNGTINQALANKIKNNEVLVIGNKRDLFSPNVKDASLKAFLKERFQEVGIKPVNVILVSATKNYNIHDFTKEVIKRRKRHDVYLIGSSLSGKSSIIDALLTVFKNTSNREIRSEIYPDTRIKILSIPFDNSSTLYEIPGFVSDDSVQNLVEKDVAKLIIPKKTIKVEKKKISKGETLLLGGLAFFSLVDGVSSTINVYTSENVELKKVNSGKVVEFFKINLIRRFLRPVSERFHDFHNYDLFDVKLNDNDNMTDIAINGLGWISLKAKGQTIRVLVPRGASLIVSNAKVR